MQKGIKNKNKKVKSKRRPIRKKVIKLSSGLVRSLEDFILLWVGFAEEISPLGSAGSMSMMKRLDLRLGGYDPNTLYRNFYKLREKGWLDPDWKLTKEGWKRLKSILPEYKKPSTWDDKWYIVAFDIPEDRRIKRNAFREKLKKLGFGRLQDSVWISPYNFLANIESLVEFHNMESWVIPSVTNKLGREDSQELAGRVWHLEEINKKYKEFFSKYKKLSQKVEELKVDKLKIQMEYLNILKDDPQLPGDLLPDDWYGKKAYKLYQKILQRSKKAEQKENNQKNTKK